MKYKFFLSYVPVMFIIGLLLIAAADRYDGKAVMVGYRTETEDLGTYDGELIRVNGTDDSGTYVDKVVDNGRNIRNDEMPYCIKVNKRQNVVTVYEAGEDGYYSKPIKAMVCSVGEGGNTPDGLYTLGSREEWLLLEDDVYGQYATAITGNILFHSVPYFTQNKNDLEIEEYNKLGSSVSAGCVRLSVIDAKWIYDNCGEGTIVNIFESDYPGPMGKPVAAVISSGGAGGNWDPTDPDRENPYMGNVPVILGAYDRDIERYSDFDVTAGVTALDSTGKDVTSRMEVIGEVEPDICGLYKVSYRVTDDTGITTEATANFIIKDEQEPELNVNQVVDSIGMYDAGSSEQLHDLLLQNVTAYDSGVRLDDSAILVDYSEILEKGCGKCHVKYRASDSEGNQSKVVVLTVDVDMEAPVLTLKNELQGDIRLSSLNDDDYLLSLVEASDNSGKVSVTVSRPMVYMVGEPYNVIYCAKDDFGNVTTFSVAYQIKE